MKQKRHAVIVGFEYYGRMLARLTNQYSSGWSMTYCGPSYLDRLRVLANFSCDALVCFGGPAPDGFFREFARHRKIPVVVIWAGTDVLTASNDPGLFEVIKQDENFNISDGEWLVDELAALGVEARYVPVTTVDAVTTPKPLPERFRVLSILPEPRRPFYGEKAVYAIAREFPDVQFTVVGKGGRNPVAPPNVEFLGYIDYMADLLDDATVLLRLPEHDGKSMMVLETLARGRHAVWTYDFPGVRRATSLTDAIAQMRTLLEAHERGTLAINTEGLEYVRAHFAKQPIIERFTNVLDEAVSTKATTKRVERRVAISGYNLFAAQVAHGLKETSCAWKPLLLRGGGRLEHLMSVVRLIDADVWYRIGSPVPDRWLHAVAVLLRKPRVVHWVGSDVTALQTNPSIRKWCQRENVIHLAEVDWIVKELATHGIGAELAPLPPHVNHPAAIPPLPDLFSVLLYLPRSRGEFYGRREAERLVRTFAKDPVRFFVVGGGELYSPNDANVTRLGWCSDMSDVYRRCSVLIRFTQHDGLSLMALEALLYGRHLIWTQDFPFALRAITYADCEAHVRELLAAHLEGRLTAQWDVARYISETYGVPRCIERIAGFWDLSVRQSPLPLDPIGASP